ncbi:hypothetical protein HK105_206785 [Polyrhizophydium stewartii]|uniref:Uncharacterized protein n=1 Tax=Polyrhizophydium stewartii TaxID=2732419 RepID=A0ABR4N2P1_9FUNG
MRLKPGASAGADCNGNTASSGDGKEQLLAAIQAEASRFMSTQSRTARLVLALAATGSMPTTLSLQSLAHELEDACAPRRAAVRSALSMWFLDLDEALDSALKNKVSTRDQSAHGNDPESKDNVFEYVSTMRGQVPCPINLPLETCADVVRAYTDALSSLLVKSRWSLVTQQHAARASRSWFKRLAVDMCCRPVVFVDAFLQAGGARLVAAAGEVVCAGG